MICPNCRGWTGVIDTSKRARFIRRRRVCEDCGHRFTTYEVQAVYLVELLEILNEGVADQLWEVGRGIGAAARRLRELDQMMHRPLAHLR